MFIVVLCKIAKIWQQPRCLSADQLIKKMWCRYKMEYYPAVKKKMKFFHLQQNGWTCRALC